MAKDDSVCELCSDSGQVIVPHPEFVIMGEWQEARLGRGKPTAAVICTCLAGGRVGHAREGKEFGKSMTLTEYESRIPRELWQRLLDEDWKRLKAEADALSQRRAKALPPVAQRTEEVITELPF